MTEDVQVASWNSWCQRQDQGWGVLYHSQGRGTMAGGTRRRDKHRLVQRCVGSWFWCCRAHELLEAAVPPSGTSAQPVQVGWVQSLQYHVEQMQQEFPQLPPQHTQYSDGCHRRAQSSQIRPRTASATRLAATHPNRKDWLGMRTPQSFGLPRNKLFSAWKPGCILL